MGSLISRIREPVKRGGAEHYLLISLLSFAASVVVTRIFLELTGYPQLGGGDFHIAHVLWGGLLLYVAAVLPLILANRAVYTLGALLSGIGVGLFIDEVGKFITRTNDYLYPPAAPIIYAFFLLTVLLYLRVRKPPSKDARAELYRALEAFTEVLDHDLEPAERAELEAGLRQVAQQTDQPELARLAKALLDFLDADTVTLAPEVPGFLERLRERALAFQARHVTRLRLKMLLVLGLLGLGIPGLLALIGALIVAFVPPAAGVSEGVWTFLLVRLGLTAMAGIPMLVAGLWLIVGWDRLGIAFAYFGLLISLTVINLLLFYYDQFQAVGGALLQFIMLNGVLYYRRRYLEG